jgi:hypothetical protein
MTVCPWCGTNYLAFQPNCQNCGGPLQIAGADESTSSVSSEDPPMPPAAPRPISDRYVWRLLSADGWAITACIFGLLGVIFSLVGAGLTVAVVTACAGIPLLLLGLAFLGSGGGLLVWRHREAQQALRVLREGDSVVGRITELRENVSVRVNGRNPWIYRYEYQVNGQTYIGQVSTLNPPAPQMQVGKAARILYLPTEPNKSSMYPHP